MKATLPSLLPLAVALTAALFLSPSVPAATKTTAPPVLQVAVDVPATWQPLLEDDVADAFFYRIRDTFKRAGLKGEYMQLKRFDEAKPDIPFLAISLMEWRINRIGNVDCTFSASLEFEGKTHRLGMFNGTSLQWGTTGNHRWALREGMENSAQSALKDLYIKLTAEHLLLTAPPPAK